MSVKQIGSRSGPTKYRAFFRTWSESNFLQRLSTYQQTALGGIELKLEYLCPIESSIVLVVNDYKHGPRVERLYKVSDTARIKFNKLSILPSNEMLKIINIMAH